MRNPYFSEGTSGVQQRYLYHEDGIEGPTGETYDNIGAPSDWIVYWLEGAPGFDPESKTGRPEAAPIFRPTFPDHQRFMPDTPYSYKAFTFWRNHFMGIGQTVKVNVGALYSWSIFAHAWYSQCSTRPHTVPLEKDCRTALDWANMLVRMGVDPDGTQSPFEDDIIWSTWHPIRYGTFDPDLPLKSPFVQATSPYVTVWLQCRTTHALKHCDLYLSEASIEEEAPPPSDCIYPAFPFKRTVHVYRPELGRARYLEIAADVWDKHGPQTISPSYDEIPLGPSDPPKGLISKDGVLWDIEADRHQSFIDYYSDNYPRKDYTIKFENAPPPPPPPPPTNGEMLSLHIQTEVEGVRDFVATMASKGNPLGWVKLVKGFESSEWIHQVSPKTKCLAREINHPRMWEDPQAQANHILDAVWPAMVRNQHIHALESTNELFGTSLTKEEIGYWVSLEIAISEEIKRRSHILEQEQGRSIIGVLLHVPIGNLQHGAQTKLLQPVIDVALENGHGIAYHPYFPGCTNFELTRTWLEEEGYHHHLRLQESWGQVLDGLFDCRIFMTEGGVIATSVRSDNRPGQYFATNGWRSSNCFGGDLDFYVECLLRLKYMMLDGPVPVETYSIFTTADPQIVGWDDFIVGPKEWPALIGALTS